MLWVIVLIVVVWLVFQPSWLPKIGDPRDTTNRAIDRSRAATRRAYQNSLGRVLPGRSAAAAQKLRDWITSQNQTQEQEMYDKLPAHAQSMSRWLASMSDSELQAFTRDAGRFVASLGWNLEWLLENKVSAYPALQHAVEEVVMLYSIAAYRAQSVSTDVKAFHAFQDWLENPGRQRALGQRLYGALVQQGLAPTDPNLYLANESARNAEAVRAIKQVAAARPEAVAAIVREYVLAPETVKMEPAPMAAA